MVEAVAPAAEGVSGPVQQPDAVQVQTLSAESRKAISTELGQRYPQQRGQINEWYLQSETPVTQADQLGAMFQKGDTAGSDIDLYQSAHLLQDQGHAPAEVAEFVSDLKANLAALELPPAIAASIGDSMIRAANDYQGDPEAMNAQWQTTTRPTIERIAKNADGSRADWDTIKQGVHAAFDKLPEEFREEVIRSGALNSAAVVLQLFHAGQRLLAMQRMRSGK